MPTDYTVWKDETLARTYLEGVRGAVPCSGEQLDVMMRLISAEGHGVGRFLDLGCGDGILGARILQRYPMAAGVLVDFSAAMLSAARERLAGYDRVTFVECDYGDPAWIEQVGGGFDAIVSGYSIHHQADGRKHALYGEILGLLNPGGVFVNVEHVASATAWGGRRFDERFIDALHAHEQRIQGTRSREEVARKYYDRDDKGANILAPVEDQCRWLRDLGFEDVDCYFKLFELAVFGGRKPLGLGG